MKIFRIALFVPEVILLMIFTWMEGDKVDVPKILEDSWDNVTHGRRIL